MNSSKKSITLLFSCLGLFLLSLLIFIYIHFIPSLSRSEFVLHIPENSNVSTIATILKKQHLIRSEFFFKLYIKLTKKEKKLRAGHFLISNGINQHQLIYTLSTKSGHYKLIKVTIPEGFSIAQIGERLESKQLVIKEEFEAFCHKKAKKYFKNKFTFLSQIPLETIEGYLFPETYFFKSKESTHTIVKTMINEFNKQVYFPFSIETNDSQLTFHQLLTLASLIEKESKFTYEMPVISSVFHNRLTKKMRLASDPTVVYALGKSHKDRVYYKDLEIQSPYNTYRKRGLPPTPIASPGIKAFHAARFPDKTDYLFFVASQDGHHHFSRTYSEHLNIQSKNKSK
ncbi:endolytic transglycosylase MltG [Candidatus Marinamargulisbacteria bacterium SCGC AG-343-D04]|nr:endolytic transglycosylase MltG [Candidatus Marinamargulisbacteria bacterium SCGC AG-343-D04]